MQVEDNFVSSATLGKMQQEEKQKAQEDLPVVNDHQFKDSNEYFKAPETLVDSLYNLGSDIVTFVPNAAIGVIDKVGEIAQVAVQNAID